MRHATALLVCAALALGVMACKGGAEGTGAGKPTGGTTATPAKPAAPVTGIAACSLPSFSLAWSEYPSWSAFGVAHVKKVISGAKGKCGPIERKYGVDIELKEMEYDPCLGAYASGAVDAVCITNMDALPPALGRPSVAILPTSTSYGADALIVDRAITEVAQLRGKTVRGLEKSVSEYTFVRNLQIAGQDPSEFTFKNMDPGAAALAMQQKQAGLEGIVVWNPFVLDTLEKRPDTHVLFDSTRIPAEIIDMVVVSQASLQRSGGEAFAKAVIAAFYEVNKMLANPATRDDTLVAIGEKFSGLKLPGMKKVVEQTLFYDTAERGIGLFSGKSSFPFKAGVTTDQLPAIMERVVAFCQSNGIVDRKPTVGYGSKSDAPNVDLRFDTAYMAAVAAGK